MTIVHYETHETGLEVGLTELPEENEVEDEADEEEDDEDLCPSVQPPSDKDRRVMLLKVNEDLRSRQSDLAVGHGTLHYKRNKKVNQHWSEVCVQIWNFFALHGIKTFK